MIANVAAVPQVDVSRIAVQLDIGSEQQEKVACQIGPIAHKKIR